jgi:hypothetical protein
LSNLVSSTTIFNEMRRRRPDLRVLLEPIETDRRGEVPEGSKPYFTIPVSTIMRGSFLRSIRDSTQGPHVVFLAVVGAVRRAQFAGSLRGEILFEYQGNRGGLVVEGSRPTIAFV